MRMMIKNYLFGRFRRFVSPRERGSAPTAQTHGMKTINNIKLKSYHNLVQQIKRRSNASSRGEARKSQRATLSQRFKADISYPS